MSPHRIEMRRFFWFLAVTAAVLFAANIFAR
jgi:hypothetical protein